MALQFFCLVFLTLLPLAASQWTIPVNYQEFVQTGSGNGQVSYGLIPWGQFLDINGDGLLDLIYQNYLESNQNVLSMIFLNTGNGFCCAYCVQNSAPSQCPNITCPNGPASLEQFSLERAAAYLDINLSELVLLVQNGSIFAEKTYSTGYRFHRKSLDQYLLEKFRLPKQQDTRSREPSNCLYQAPYSPEQVSAQRINILNVSEVSDIVQVSEQTVLQLLESGTLKGLYLEGRWRISEKALDLLFA